MVAKHGATWRFWEPWCHARSWSSKRAIRLQTNRSYVFCLHKPCTSSKTIWGCVFKTPSPFAVGLNQKPKGNHHFQSPMGTLRRLTNYLLRNASPDGLTDRSTAACQQRTPIVLCEVQIRVPEQVATQRGRRPWKDQCGFHLQANLRCQSPGSKKQM